MSIRAASLFSARPYIAYVDEGNLLHPVISLLRQGGWDPHWYLYPQFPIVAVAAVLRIWAPVYRLVHGRPLLQDLSPPPEIYDNLEPFDVLIAARAINLALEAAIIVLTGLFARRLAGPRAGVAATWLAALVPALAIRGAIAAVDPYATLFALVSLMLADRARTSPRPGLASLGAGLAAGCAFASKYPSVAVFIAFAVTTLVSTAGWIEKARRIALGLAGLIVGAAVAMPVLLSHPRDVFEAIRTQAALYAQLP
ncbi:MAG: glycosyltransferase family 39 protein, partial [Thermoanaerobaculia bacterium]